MLIRKFIFCCSFAFLLAACGKEVGPPVIESIEPAFAPAEALVTIQGANLANIKEVKFSDQVINFNNAYNADNALLLRIATNVPLGEHIISLTTDGGTATTNFRVTLEPPEIFNFTPASAAVGEQVTIKGKNFYEPLTAWFFDSVQAEIVSLAPDSMVI